MKRISMFILAVAAAGLTAGAASAQSYSRDSYGSQDSQGSRDSYGSRVEQRDNQQDYRIRDNWRNGDLSPSELRQVRAMQRRIQIMQRQAWADGHISGRERAQIRRAQNRLNQMIQEFAHNNDGRWDRNGRRGNGRSG